MDVPRSGLREKSIPTGDFIEGITPTGMKG
jgi:hypothetical protein